MASKFLVYIAVVYLSCIAFCTVDSSWLGDMAVCTAKIKLVNMVLKILKGRLKGICVVNRCKNYRKHILSRGCQMKQKCYLPGETVNGKKCTTRGRWT
ncbi:hypothetical protein PoB_001779600 [Plakobranchus ocellatus]|uniref:Uncharacterized protein n=1 Tax=Plakobranchus ocellatus TaxID=259542 RepID=A0AAV3Z5Z6_9GAST|nr:hypothetical protein PoB_001779600 [Plakobranchus ocellatus]